MANIHLDWDLLHPTARSAFYRLYDRLGAAYEAGETPTLFRPFEGYRTPQRQQALFDQKRTKARPFQSAHQYGLAVDFVPWFDGHWSWDLSHDWDYLRRCATALGLDNSIEWDRPHVEARSFAAVRAALIPQIAGSAA